MTSFRSIALFVSFLCSTNFYATQIVHLTKENFDKMVATIDKPLIIDVYAHWCGPCKLFKPTFEDYAAKHADTYVCADLNYDESFELAKSLKVKALPTIVIMHKKEVLGKIVGMVAPESFPQKVETIVRYSGKKISELPKEVQQERLKEAIDGGSVDEVAALLDAGISVNEPLKIDGVREIHPLALAISAAFASELGLDVVELLLSRGASQKALKVPGMEAPTDAIEIVKPVVDNFKKMHEQAASVLTVLEQAQ
jgi:thioredoxin